MINVYTIGVYGSTEDEFFQKLIDSKVDTFCDIRRRHGMRGDKYAFANSKRLQARLKELDINYVHYIYLAPTVEVKNIQEMADKKQRIRRRERILLSNEFIDAYKKEHLTNFDANDFLKALGSKAKNVMLCCVEKEPEACHRSLVAEYLKSVWKDFKVIHL